jgi:hypothetical protein
VNHISDIVEETPENKEVFLDIGQAFDRIGHRGQRHKLGSILPDHFYQFINC